MRKVESGIRIPSEQGLRDLRTYRFQKLLRGPNARRFLSRLALVFDPEMAVVSSGENDFEHAAIIRLRLVPGGIEIMRFRAHAPGERHHLFNPLVAVVIRE